MAADELPPGWVRLNVGGRIFVTMKQTLRASPFFARLFESDDRMPDAMARSPTHFIDRDPDRFTKILNYLRDGKLLADKNCNLEELRLEADFFGLENLVRIVENEMKATKELRYATKYVVVSWRDGAPGNRLIGINVNPHEDDHFLLRHLRQRYPCRVRTAFRQFPYDWTVYLGSCSVCPQCASEQYEYDYHCERGHGPGQQHGCTCTPDTSYAMQKDIVPTLESQGYVMDRNVEAIVTAAAGKGPTSWTFVKRES